MVNTPTITAEYDDGKIRLVNVWEGDHEAWKRVCRWILEHLPIESTVELEFRRKDNMDGIGIMTIEHGEKKYVRDYISCFDHLAWAQRPAWRGEEMQRILKAVAEDGQ